MLTLSINNANLILPENRAMPKIYLIKIENQSTYEQKYKQLL